LLIVAAVLALTLTAAPVALAGNSSGGPSSPAKAKGKAFVCHGKVVSVDVDAKTITLTVWSGTKGLRKYRGQDLVVQVPDGTKIVRRAFGEATAVGLADVKPGERIWVAGKADRSSPNAVVYTARWVRLHATWPFAAKGTVTGIDTTAMTLTVKIDRAMVALKPFTGDEVIFTITADTVFKKCVDEVCTPIVFGDVVLGDNVLVGGTVDNTAPDDKQFIAKRVIVRG
jgi:hypothetical protein